LVVIDSPGDTMPDRLGESEKSGRAMRAWGLRLMAIRQARLEPLALSGSSRERMIHGWAAASEDKRIGFSVRIARFGDILK